MRIGIVDTGIDQTHPDLSGQTVACARSQGLLPILSGSIEVGQCADDNDHGTHVAGTIAAKANNGIGVAGVAFNADLVICKALERPARQRLDRRRGQLHQLGRSQGAKVISMSLGGGASTTLQNAVANAWNNGNGARDRRGRRQRGRRHAQLPGRLPARSCRSPPPTTATRARASRTRTRTWRSRRPA